jgi:anthranilate synthase component 1
MLVDLARNDLSRVCEHVKVAQYRQVKYYSHVIHLVSEVIARVRENANPFELMAKTFPAGTLSGAPKFRAMELIDNYEKTPRSFYGGAIGMVGFDGSCNQAILIRSFLSRNNTLYCQAGAGVVASSIPENELQEVNNKLGALKKACWTTMTHLHITLFILPKKYWVTMSMFSEMMKFLLKKLGNMIKFYFLPVRVSLKRQESFYL